MKLWFCLSTGPLFNRQEDAEGLFCCHCEVVHRGNLFI